MIILRSLPEIPDKPDPEISKRVAAEEVALETTEVTLELCTLASKTPPDLVGGSDCDCDCDCDCEAED